MATSFELPGFSFTLPSNADFSSAAGQFRFVDVNGSGKAAASALAGEAIGVRQNKPKANEATTIMCTGISFVEAGETVAAGALIKAMAGGTAGVAATLGDAILGKCLVGGVAGELLAVLLNGPGPHVKFA